MSRCTCRTNEPIDEETMCLIESIEKTLALVKNSMDMYTGWLKTATHYSAEALRHNLEHIYIPCHDVLKRAIYLLTTTSTNYNTASAINIEVANIIGVASVMTKYRSCNVNFCGCKLRQLYNLIGTNDVFSLQQIHMEDEAHAAQDAYNTVVNELEEKKKAYSAARYALHSFHWDIHASDEDEMERIKALVAASTAAKNEHDDCEELLCTTKASFNIRQRKLYDAFRTTLS